MKDLASRVQSVCTSGMISKASKVSFSTRNKGENEQEDKRRLKKKRGKTLETLDGNHHHNKRLKSLCPSSWCHSCKVYEDSERRDERRGNKLRKHFCLDLILFRILMNIRRHDIIITGSVVQNILESCPSSRQRIHTLHTRLQFISSSREDGLAFISAIFWWTDNVSQALTMSRAMHATDNTLWESRRIFTTKILDEAKGVDQENARYVMHERGHKKKDNASQELTLSNENRGEDKRWDSLEKTGVPVVQKGKNSAGFWFFSVFSRQWLWLKKTRDWMTLWERRRLLIMKAVVTFDGRIVCLRREQCTLGCKVGTGSATRDLKRLEERKRKKEDNFQQKVCGWLCSQIKRK